MRRIWPAAIQRASSAQSPRSTTTPASRSTARPRPAISGLGSSMAHTTRRMPAATMALAQGGVRPWCEQGSRLTYMVRPRARAPARSSACASACGRPPGCVQPRLIISPVVSSAMMAPTAGLGAVRPSMRCAMRSASSMRRRSRSMVEVLDERAIQHHTSASCRPPRRRAAWAWRCRSHRRPCRARRSRPAPRESRRPRESRDRPRRSARRPRDRAPSAPP